MAPNGETLVSTYSRNDFNKPPKLSMDGLQRAVSDLSFQLSKETLDATLPPISEVEDAKCECCGMSEECTLEYIHRVREKFSGKWICGLCAEAVKEEVDKNGGGEEEALSAHMSACVRFNRIGKAYPALYQADAMREILKKSRSMIDGRGFRAKSNSPRDRGSSKKGSIMRSSSCIPAITRELLDPKTEN
ncbi:hypothetical protein MRB53_012927 [Persea americana]|uniref:Uncharacterized protein n=1 Tax=Persea americana TaxID=3435 RepID=A0ACC2LZ10_PERAE|nr:hypothetical protein MRB53_012927 [Persea americana]|eukprot:TRINITY_DN7240_c0_g1_i1.p1 TRINITY_DN7240_c0_g1~~TRINITY_DN7240_c0_g1_i1.p1  ORF type:complete len:190 (-),score=38.31 TRINITY_DN7240_c0_g1_i1:173-742(-)